MNGISGNAFAFITLSQIVGNSYQNEAHFLRIAAVVRIPTVPQLLGQCVTATHFTRVTAIYLTQVTATHLTSVTATHFARVTLLVYASYIYYTVFNILIL